MRCRRRLQPHPSQSLSLREFAGWVKRAQTCVDTEGRLDGSLTIALEGGLIAIEYASREAEILIRKIVAQKSH